jgi:hypothetical protein
MLEGRLAIEPAGAAGPPRVALEARLADATIGAPLLGGAGGGGLDLGAGRVTVAARLQGTGHGRGGLLATLAGEVTLAVADGQLIGYDLPAVQAAAALPELAAAEAALRRVLLAPGGATAFERLEAAAAIAEGRLTLERAGFGTEGGGGPAAAQGTVDLARGVVDLVLSTAPVASAPPVGLRLNGPVEAPRRLPELAPFLRWKAEQG